MFYICLNCCFPPQFIPILPLQKSQTFWIFFFLIILWFSWQWLSRDNYHIHHLHQIYLYLLVKIQLVITELQMELPEQPRSQCICARNTWSHCGEGAERICHYTVFIPSTSKRWQKMADCYLTSVLISGLSAGFRVFFKVIWILQVIKDNIGSRCDVKLPINY